MLKLVSFVIELIFIDSRLNKSLKYTNLLNKNVRNSYINYLILTFIIYIFGSPFILSLDFKYTLRLMYLTLNKFSSVFQQKVSKKLIKQSSS